MNDEPRITAVFKKEFDLERYIAALYELARLKRLEREAQKTQSSDEVADV